MVRFFRQSWLSYKALYSFGDPKVYLMMMVLNPALQLIYYGLMVRFAYGSEDISKWIIGNGFLLASSNCIFVIGRLIASERNEGTLIHVVASPANGFKVFLSRSILHVFDIFVRVALGFVMGTLFFGFRIWDISLLKLLFAILAGMASGLGFGMLLGSFALLTTDIHLFLNTTESILTLFTGALFPLVNLPDSIRWISGLTPLTRSIEAAKMLLQKSQEGFYRLVSTEVVIGILFTLLAYGTFEICQYFARKGGGLELY